MPTRAKPSDGLAVAIYEAAYGECWDYADRKERKAARKQAAAALRFMADAQQD